MRTGTVSCGRLKRDFQVFDPLDFLAEVTQHIPDTGEHLVRYYGFYSNKSRGLRAKAQGQAGAAAPEPASAPSAKEVRQRWAALIKQVYEVDPLFCPKCGGEMKIISFIERRQSEVIEKILRHCGLWDETPARAPPAGEWLWAEDQLKELRTGCWRGFLEILRGTWRLAFRPKRVISTPKPPDSLLLLLSGLEMTENLR